MPTPDLDTYANKALAFGCTQIRGGQLRQSPRDSKSRQAKKEAHPYSEAWNISFRQMNETDAQSLVDDFESVLYTGKVSFTPPETGGTAIPVRFERFEVTAKSGNTFDATATIVRKRGVTL